jgi:hypothetical protein
MLRTERETSIDMVGASDLKLFYASAAREATAAFRGGDRHASLDHDGGRAHGAVRHG